MFPVDFDGTSNRGCNKRPRSPLPAPPKVGKYATYYLSNLLSSIFSTYPIFRGCNWLVAGGEIGLNVGRCPLGQSSQRPTIFCYLLVARKLTTSQQWLPCTVPIARQPVHSGQVSRSKCNLGGPCWPAS